MLSFHFLDADGADGADELTMAIHFATMAMAIANSHRV